MINEISAGAVIFRQDMTGIRHYLLLQYRGGHWDFPRGNVEENEAAEVTARREIEEETGIEDIRFIPRFSERIVYFYTRNGHKVSKEAVFLLAETKNEKVTLSYEHRGFQWLDYKGAYERITYRNSKNVLEKAERFLSAIMP